MRIFLDNKGVSTLWSQFKAKLAVHVDDSNIHVTAEEKAAWDGKAELSDIPDKLPADGGNAATAITLSDWSGSVVENADDAPLGLSKIDADGANNPFKFWAEILTLGEASNQSYRQQWAFPWSNNEAPLKPKYRVKDAGVWGPWQKLNDGGNADTLDGKHASDFADNIYKGYPKEGNCNNATAQGVYTVSNNSTNAPGSDFYTLIVDVAGDGTWIVQTAISAGTESVAYRRTRINGNWGAWKNIADGGNAATVNGYTVNANVPAGFSSIGQNTENKTYTYGRVTYTGHNTSEVFNNYTENMAANEYSHAEGYDTKALGDHSHAEGSGTKALGFHSHAECSSTEASGDGSHAEGMDTTASGECSHAEGSMTTASSSASHAEGSSTRASGNDSHAEGSSTKASGSHSHAEGSLTEASGESSHAEGLMTGASSSASHAEGYGTIASSFASHAGGKYSKAMTNSTGETDNTGDAFVIGNGTEAYTLSNAFRVTYGDAVYGLSAFNSSGADYAEFIKPWADGNPDNEDRVGYMVTIKNGLLHKANDGDYIVGITSGNPSVVGNADEDYYWRYARDEFNRFVYEDAEEEVEQLDDDGAPVLDENGMPVMVKTGNIIKNAHYKLAADYNPTKQNDYIERKNRPEWSYVGMVGVIPVRDDGTCEAGCFCKCGQNGIATRAESRGFDTFFVIERISDNVVSVEIR